LRCFETRPDGSRANLNITITAQQYQHLTGLAETSFGAAAAHRHHITPWSQGGRTDIDNLTLVCKQHHRTFEKHQWRCEMRDGLPYWIPPAWCDPEQTPQHNRHWPDDEPSRDEPDAAETDHDGE
jgi:hypothetical protein